MVLGIVIIGGVGVYFFQDKKAVSLVPMPVKKVASAKSISTKIPSVTSQEVMKVSPTITPTPTKSAQTKKKEYTIAVYGDSMVETMGERTDYLEHRLNDMYPTTSFKFYNYGIGGQNAQEGLGRFEAAFNYKTRNYPPIIEVKPDIIIIGSFAYNPPVPYDRDKHWTTLIELVRKAQGIGADVYLLAEIAPLENDFGKGPGGVNWPADLSREQARKITELLDNTVNLGSALSVPVINVYDATNGSGKYGSSAYTDPNDGIHPSVAGHTFMANMIANKLDL